MNRHFAQAALALAACLPAIASAAWPDKPIRMVVPYAAGGNADVTARIVAQRMGTALGQQIIIDNRPGAGGAIGEDNVAKSAGDGYTVLFDASGFSVNPSLRKLPFDPATDFIPVSLVTTAPQILVVPLKSPYKTVDDLVKAARAESGGVTYASAGAGTASHLAAEGMNFQGKFKMTHVPYKGGAPALNDVMGGQVAAYFGSAASTLGYVTAGKLRALAVSSSKRLAALPEVPTLAESGFPGFDVVEWNGVFLPKGTPPDVVAKVADSVRTAVNDPDVKAKLLQFALVPVGSTPAEFAKYVQGEIARVHGLAKAMNLTLD